MEQFSPEQLECLIGDGGDQPLAPIPAHLSHAEKVALRRARIEAIDRAQAAHERAEERPPEAVVRGFARPRAPARAKSHELPDDALPVEQRWIRDNLSRIYRIGPVWTVSAARKGHPRWVWRAAVAGLLLQSRDDVRSPEYVIANWVERVASRELSDPRSMERYQAWPNWPKPLYEFANVALPQAYKNNRS